MKEVNTKVRKKYKVESIVEGITAEAYTNKRCENYIDVIGERLPKIT
jgi:hypothetical protein